MIKVSLDYPIEVKGELISELELRRPKLKDALKAEKAGTNDPERERHMFASLTGLSPSALLELDIGDYRNLQESYLDFFGSARQTSGEES